MVFIVVVSVVVCPRVSGSSLSRANCRGMKSALSSIVSAVATLLSVAESESQLSLLKTVSIIAFLSWCHR